jgi:hypothetical protein
MSSKKRVHLQQFWHNFIKACLLRCKITHTNYSHHWYIRTRLQCGHIFMTRYAKSHAHQSSSQVIDLAARGYQIRFISADDLDTWFLAWLIKESFCLATLKFWFARQKLSINMLILQGKIMRYAPSRFWLVPHLTIEHKRKIQRGWKHIP